MNTTVIYDNEGKPHVVPQSDRNTGEAIRRIAAAKIKAYNLNCTVDEYLQKCKEVQDAKNG